MGYSWLWRCSKFTKAAVSNDTFFNQRVLHNKKKSKKACNRLVGFVLTYRHFSGFGLFPAKFPPYRWRLLLGSSLQSIGIMKKTIIAFLLVTILTSCAPAVQTTLQAETSTLTPTAVLTLTPFPSPSAAPPMLTPLPSATPTAAPPTPTPLATFQDPEAEIRSLIRNHGGCQLPCWWGITPGVTSWLDASRFFARFSDHVTIEESRRGQIDSRPYQQFIVYYRSGLSIDYAVSTTIEVTEGTVRLLLIDLEASIASGYSPKRILSDLGEPDEVLVNDMDTSLSNLTLWYESRGVAATFLVDEDESSQELCLIAFQGTATWDSFDPSFRALMDDASAVPLQERFSISAPEFLSVIAMTELPVCVPLAAAQ